MSSNSPITLDLADLRRLLRESERDVAALSREEAERILQIREPSRRLKAYMTLCESWGNGGDRLLADDEARILASLTALNSPDADPLPRPPAPGMPLTPLSLVTWAARWRLMLVESGLRRATALGVNMSPAAFESLASAQDDVREAERFPEVPVLHLLDTLMRELQEGLQSRLLQPEEALSGHVSNLSGLLRSVVAAKAKRVIAIPPTPATPPLRSAIADILAWLEALLAYEEAIGARALLEAGVAVEPADAAARFRAAARQGADDVQGHASAQLSSWRRADRAHRAVAAAQRAGWLRRDRPVSLPSFDVDELERWFSAFAAPHTPLQVPPPAVASPAVVQVYWSERRRLALRRVALALLAEGVVPDMASAEQQATVLAVGGSMAFADEGREVQQADRVIGLCAQIIVSGAQVGPIADASDADGIVNAWVAATISAPAPRIPSPLASPTAAIIRTGLTTRLDASGAIGQVVLPESWASSPQPVRQPAPAPQEPPVVRPLPESERPLPVAAPALAPAQSRVVAGRAALKGLRARFSAAVAGASVITAGSIVVVFGCLLYQGAMLLHAGATGGVQAVVSELMLRSALLTDPMWFLSGLLPLLALLLLSFDVRRIGSLVRGRGWRVGTALRVLVATGLIVGGGLLDQPLRFAFTGAGLPAWPERVVEQGGVPTSTFNAAEGTWLSRRIVEAVRADDLPAMPAGQPPLLLLREVGFLGGFRGWWLANVPDAEALTGRPAHTFGTAPAAIERKSTAR